MRDLLIQLPMWVSFPLCLVAGLVEPTRDRKLFWRATVTMLLMYIAGTIVGVHLT